MASSWTWKLMAWYCLTLSLDRVTGSQEVMKKLTLGFSKMLNECKTELNLPDHIMQDMFSFWKEDYALLNREVGCAIMCMASKHNLVTDDMKMHHENAQEFAKSHGADDETAKQLVTMLHECEKSQEAINDDCEKTLEVSKCFRTKIHALKWAPDMETIVAELMADS